MAFSVPTITRGQRFDIPRGHIAGLDGPKVAERFNQGSGGSYKVLAGKLRWLDLAGYRFDEPVAEFGIDGEGFEMEGRSGVIGRGLMEPFMWPSTTRISA